MHVEIDQDVKCKSCGYNLRGLRSDSRCPECGIAAGTTLFGWALWKRNTSSLLHVRRGTTWFRVALLATLLLPGIYVAVSWVPLSDANAVFGYYVVALIGQVLVQVSYAIAAFELTASIGESNLPTFEYPPCPRRAIRLLAVVGVIAGIAGGLCESTGSSITGLVWVATVTTLGSTVMLFLVLRYLRTLAQCAPDVYMARSLTIVVCVLTLVVAAFLAWLALEYVLLGAQLWCAAAFCAVLWSLRLLTRRSPAHRLDFACAILMWGLPMTMAIITLAPVLAGGRADIGWRVAWISYLFTYESMPSPFGLATSLYVAALYISAACAAVLIIIALEVLSVHKSIVQAAIDQHRNSEYVEEIAS